MSRGCGYGTDACDGNKKTKLTSITFEFTGKEPLIGNKKNVNSQWNHAQSSYPKIQVGKPVWKADASKYTLKIKGSRVYDLGDELYLGKYVRMNGGEGTTFTLRASDSGKKTLNNLIKMKVAKTNVWFSAGACKYPLRIGDEFGPLRVIAFTTTTDDSCAFDAANRLEDTSQLAGAAAVTNVASSAGAGTSTAAMAIGVIGAVIIVLAAVGAVVYVRRGDQSAALQPGAFEVDLDTQEIRRIPSDSQIQSGKDSVEAE